MVKEQLQAGFVGQRRRGKRRSKWLQDMEGKLKMMKLRRAELNRRKSGEGEVYHRWRVW